jgi:hypothetical protein
VDSKYKCYVEKKYRIVASGEDAIVTKSLREFEQILIFFHPCHFFNQFYYLAIRHSKKSIQLQWMFDYFL